MSVKKHVEDRATFLTYALKF